jgi:quercetin dioxygenase-like cupin family protein
VAAADFTIVQAEDVEDSYGEDRDVPGEFHPLTDALGAGQIAITLIRVPAHSDFEQGTGHTHDETEELNLVTRGSLTMRFDDEVRRVGSGSVARVGPGTVRSHRNEGDETVEMWAISRKEGGSDSTKVEDFWEESPQARQRTGTQ